MSVAITVPKGSIPAWAGKPRPRPGAADPCVVYPRVGGETCHRLTRYARCNGLSPRGRGNPRNASATAQASGSIPAWAGKPPRRMAGAPPPKVYPRVGGETSAVGIISDGQSGLSPRGRGNRRRQIMPMLSSGSIPAWAGKPRASPCASADLGVYPRVGGETAMASSGPAANSGLSPRGRGNQ